MKIAIVGAGSVGFARKLIRDVVSVPELRDCEIALHDINEHNLAMVAQLVDRDIEANGLPTRITRHVERRPALDGARYVINCIRAGGLEAYRHDIEIPLRYGVDQCVGDTICAGGIMYGQRSMPQIVDICRDIAAVGEPGAWFLNYANPMAMNTWAALDHGGVANTIGLCHGIYHGWKQIAEALGVDDADRLEYLCAGINHQSWYLDLRLDGRRIDAEELLAAFERHPEFRNTEKVRIDVLRRFGFYSTESNGHLSEYLPWYRKRPEETRNWIDLSDWIHGETGGYLRVSLESRNWFETDFPRWLAKAGGPITAETRSEEHASYIIEALETGRPYRGHFNVRNNGIIANLPEDCIVEAPGTVDRLGLHMKAGIILPLGCAATCQASVNVQRMAVRACADGDLDLLRLAMLHDPLVAAVCNPDEVWQMVDEFLVAQARWLPHYARHVAGAGERLAKATVKTRDWQGAARREPRSISHLQASTESFATLA